MASCKQLSTSIVQGIVIGHCPFHNFNLSQRSVNTDEYTDSREHVVKARTAYLLLAHAHLEKKRAVHHRDPGQIVCALFPSRSLALLLFQLAKMSGGGTFYGRYGSSVHHRSYTQEDHPPNLPPISYNTNVRRGVECL